MSSLPDAKQKLPNGKTHLVVIADNLDRIVPIHDDYGRNSHDEIFLDRSDQLQGLDCHLIYTIPISMVYSNRANDLKEIYGNPDLLPMVMVQTPNGAVHPPGLAKMQEVLMRRIQPHIADVQLGRDVFENEEVVTQLCLASGGHVRELLLLVKESLNRTETLPIPTTAVRRAIATTRDTYRRTVEKRAVAGTGQSGQNPRHRQRRTPPRPAVSPLPDGISLLFDEEGTLQCWYDAHPLIKAIPEF